MMHWLLPGFQCLLTFIILLECYSTQGSNGILNHPSALLVQIYGGVTLNNTMSLGVFLAIVYGRRLVWEFTAEVLTIALVTVIMGLAASIRKTFPLWISFLALSLYPLSLALVAVLDYIVGWE
jgi:hypothetical protein